MRVEAHVFRVRFRLGRAALPVLLLLGLALLPGPAIIAQTGTRTESIQTARLDKAKALVPEERSPTDKRLSWATEAVLDSLTYGVKGLGLRFGGLPTGQGFALGPQFTRHGLGGGRAVLRTSAAGSFAGAYLLDLQVSVPKLAGENVFLDFVGVYGNYPQIDYYGPSPESDKGGRSHFRLEENRYDLIAGVRPAQHVYLGLTGGYLGINVGRGRRKDVAQADGLYDEETTPGLQRQTDFVRGGVFARLDYRDDPIGARSGGMYHAHFSFYNDFRLNQYDFRQLDLEARQYFPLFNRRRVIALAGAATMTFRNGTSLVPFYLQPTLGGSEDLRGFRSYRFYDDNLIVVNAEYRWEAFSGLDMALFFDAGKVAPKHSQLNFHALETSVGFGFRFNARNRTFLRIDTGFSHEGFQVWFKFGAPPAVRTRATALTGRR